MKKLLIILVVGLFAVSSLSSVSSSVEQKQTIVLKFSFGEPIIHEMEVDGREYAFVSIDGCDGYGGETGKPSLPFKTVNVLLPPHSKLEGIKVYGTGKTEVKLENLVAPSSTQYMSLSYPSVVISKIDRDIIAVNLTDMNSTNYGYGDSEDLYKQLSTVYPKCVYEKVGIQYKRGFPILVLNLYPVQYDASLNKLYCYKELKLEVDTKIDPTIPLNPLYRGKPSDIDLIKSMVENPYTALGYPIYGEGTVSSLYSGDNSGNGGTDTCDMVIITTKVLAKDYSLWRLKTEHEKEGLKVEIATVEDIYRNYDGKNKQEKIRNFIKHEYMTKGIEYVLLVGDDDWTYEYIPFFPFILRDKDLDDGSYGVPTQQYYLFSIEIWAIEVKERVKPRPPDPNPPDNKTCFLAGTKITLADGSVKNIEDIKPGDVVLSWQDGKVVPNVVTKVFHHSPEQMGDYYLVINDDLKVTPNHPILVNGRWIPAGELKIGDKLLNIDGRQIDVKSIEKIHSKVPTYNLEVANAHNYFANGILVHNKKKERKDPIVIDNDDGRDNTDSINLHVQKGTEVAKENSDRIDTSIKVSKSNIDIEDINVEQAKASSSTKIDTDGISSKDTIVRVIDPFYANAKRSPGKPPRGGTKLLARYDVTIASDLYYACLDDALSFSRGKVIKPPKGYVGTDYLAEVYVGRAPVSSISDLRNFVENTIDYMHKGEDSLDVLLLGEHLGFGGPAEYGKDSMEELIQPAGNSYACATHGYTTRGIPLSKYMVHRLYEKDRRWSGQDFISLSKDMDIVNHLGHANMKINMKLGAGDLYFRGRKFLSAARTEGTFIAYSQGCFAGAFDYRDCVAEYFTVKGGGAVAGVWNTHFGWGRKESTDGPSQRYNRQFWDAIFGEGKARLGEANQDSKEDNIHYLGRGDFEGMIMQWLYICINLLGDPALRVKGAIETNNESPHLEIFPQHYSTELTIGETAKTSFAVWNSGNGAINYQILENCSWIHVDPTEGSSRGEHDMINVTIDTTNISFEGTMKIYRSSIKIVSEYGNATFRVAILVFSAKDHTNSTSSTSIRNHSYEYKIDIMNDLRNNLPDTNTYNTSEKNQSAQSQDENNNSTLTKKMQHKDIQSDTNTHAENNSKDTTAHERDDSSIPDTSRHNPSDSQRTKQKQMDKKELYRINIGRIIDMLLQKLKRFPAIKRFISNIVSLYIS